MSPWTVLGWLLVSMVSFGLLMALLVAASLTVAVVLSMERQKADVRVWEEELPERTEWKSWEHGRATVVVKAPRPGPDRSASIQSDDLGHVFGSVPQIAKLLLQRRYRRV